MRVISGKYKGKRLEGFDIDGTRPTMDRIKESLFASIQNNIYDSVCLDLYAGSGSLGIEALSNGAMSCFFVDKGREISRVLTNNLRGIENAYMLYMDAFTAIDKFKSDNIKFDMVFLDPPYSLDLITPTLEKIKDILNTDAIIVCEYESEVIGYDITFYELYKDKKYGDKKVLFLRVK